MFVFIYSCFHPDIFHTFAFYVCSEEKKQSQTIYLCFSQDCLSFWRISGKIPSQPNILLTDNFLFYFVSQRFTYKAEIKDLRYFVELLTPRNTAGANRNPWGNSKLQGHRTVLPGTSGRTRDHEYGSMLLLQKNADNLGYKHNNIFNPGDQGNMGTLQNLNWGPYFTMFEMCDEEGGERRNGTREKHRH